MTRSTDAHFRSDGSIDIDHYRRAATEERTKAIRHAHDRIDGALAAIVRGAKDFLTRPPEVRVPARAAR